MWAIHNHTAYAVERTWIRDAHGLHHWIVVVKATFEFDDYGRLRLADEQLPPLHEPEYLGEPGRSSLRYEADLIARKPSTDVIVNAHAHAPGGRATREIVVGLRVHDLDKALLVRRDEPFVSWPIVYEHAYGGADMPDEDPRRHRIDPRNPVGVGLVSSRPAPSVLYPRGDPSRAGPAGFGAIASHWSPRLELGGRYDEAWARKRKPLLPADYDEAHLLCSPVDQRPRERLRGGERIGLVNLTPTGALQLELPTIGLSASTRVSVSSCEHGFELATVVIEAEQRRLIMVWQSSLRVAATEVEYLDGSEICEL
jgi:hypothetical protein